MDVVHDRQLPKMTLNLVKLFKGRIALAFCLKAPITYSREALGVALGISPIDLRFF